MRRPCEPAQRHAIFTVTKKSALGTRAAYRTVEIVTMTAIHQQRSSRSRALHQVAEQHRCVAQRPVVISTWNKPTDPGHQN